MDFTLAWKMFTYPTISFMEGLDIFFFPWTSDFLNWIWLTSNFCILMFFITRSLTLFQTHPDMKEYSFLFRLIAYQWLIYAIIGWIAVLQVHYIVHAELRFAY